MRIIVNDIAASCGGALTVLRDFYNTVRTLNDRNEWIFLLGSDLIEETDNIRVITLPEVKASHIKRLCFDLFNGRKIINSLKPDVVLSLQNTKCFGVKCKQVVYVHQSLPFQKQKSFSFFKREERGLAVYQHILGSFIKLSIKRADKVIVQTEWMRKAVIADCSIPESRVDCFPPNIKGIAKNSETAFDSNKFFYPTNNNIYKNIPCIEQAVGILHSENIDCDVELTVSEKFADKSIKGIGYIDHSAVEQKYFERTLLFPSYMETFGYPLAEAMQAGTIILASDCPFSHEVLEGYPNAYFFDYKQPAQLAELMKKVINKEIVKEDYSVCGILTTNSWEQLIADVLLK